MPPSMPRSAMCASRPGRAGGARLCYTLQTLGEFWNSSTRPFDKNGFGLSVPETDRLARVIERDFEFLPDSREVHDRWRSLLVAHNIQGVQVHDARLAASMYVHGVGQLLTINVRDFRRFDNLRVLPSGRIVRGTMSKSQAAIAEFSAEITPRSLELRSLNKLQ